MAMFAFRSGEKGTAITYTVSKKPAHVHHAREKK